jgi:hypothetical protein
MVSSFLILTNIRIPKNIAKIFNKEFNPCKYTSKKIIKDMEKYNISISSYFDSVIIHKDGEGGLKSLDIFLEKGEMWPLFIEHNNWAFNENNTLFDWCEKFHGAISVLEFFIERFFKPQSILLNGTIIGINTDLPMGYVYNVRDNVISMDQTFTRKILEELDIKCKEEEQYYEQSKYDYEFDRDDFLDKYFQEYIKNESYDIKVYDIDNEEEDEEDEEDNEEDEEEDEEDNEEDEEDNEEDEEDNEEDEEEDE